MILRNDYGCDVTVKPGKTGDFKVTVAGTVVIDKAKYAGDFTKLNGKPWPKPEAAARVAVAIESKAV